MYGNGGGGKAAKADKKGISLKERAKGLASAKGLAKLDVLQKPLKAAARKQLIKSQMKGK
jgi:hypothetical protein